MSLLDTYIKRVNAQLREHKVQLDVLKSKAKEFAAVSKNVGKAELALAEKQLAGVKSRLKEFSGSGGVALGEMKIGVKKALADLQLSTKRAARHLKTGAAPAPANLRPAPKRRSAAKTAAPRRAKAGAR